MQPRWIHRERVDITSNVVEREIGRRDFTWTARLNTQSNQEREAELSRIDSRENEGKNHFEIRILKVPWDRIQCCSLGRL
jgi:hypothetical protein